MLAHSSTLNTTQTENITQMYLGKLFHTIQTMAMIKLPRNLIKTAEKTYFLLLLTWKEPGAKLQCNRNISAISETGEFLLSETGEFLRCSVEEPGVKFHRHPVKKLPKQGSLL